LQKRLREIHYLNKVRRSFSMISTMTRRVVRTENAPKPGGQYSQAIATEELVYVAGSLGTDPRTGNLPEGVEAQTRQALTNIKSILEAAGSSMEKVLRVGVYLRDIKDFQTMNTVYSTFFTKDPPARTTIQAVLAGTFLVEVDAVALKER